MSNLFAKKDVNKLLEENAAKESTKTLGLFDVILMGVGATIGTGVLVIAGLVAARDAGPSVSISFVISAVACILVALCYAEFGSAIPSSGGAYTYIYVSLGKFVAHLIGWSIVGCYTVSLASVAGGWSSYVNNVLTEFGIRLPESFTAIPSGGGIINLPAVFIVLCMSFLLTRGVKESKKINNLMVLIKIGIVLLFVAVGVFFIHTNNWHPFTPFGVKGIFAGAASVFFAYNGFDAISTSAEEVKNPQRNLPLGILIALSVCTVIYVVIALVLTGMVSYKELNVGDALSYALNSVGQEWAALIVS
ncbi:amino acid permease, partial [Priestia megaterium]